MNCFSAAICGQKPLRSKAPQVKSPHIVKDEQKTFVNLLY